MEQKINRTGKSKLNTKILKFIFLISICLILLLPISAAEDWPMFRHDSGHTGETSDVIKNPEDLELKWKFKTNGEVYSSPAASGNYIYVGSYDGYVYCLNKDTGELLWKFETGSRVHSSPAISGNFVYVGSWDNYVYCLDKNTGELKWKFKTGWEIWSSPVLSGNYLYIGSHDTNVYCLDKNTGELKWKFTAGLAISSSPAVSGNYIYIGSWDNYIYCLNKDTGELKWKFKTERAVSSSPAVSGNYVYVSSEDSYVYCLNKDTGELKWKFETGGGIWVSPAVSGDYIYIGSNDGIVYCLDKNNGNVKWKFETGGMYSSPAISGNYIYIGSYKGYLYCLNKNTGELIWKFKTGGLVNPSPAIAQNFVYVGSDDGYVYAFVALKSIGSTCDKNSECKNDNCFKSMCKPAEYVCDSDSDCISGKYCSNNKCMDLKQIGSACSGNSECKNGNCFKGICREQSVNCITSADCSSNQHCSCSCPEYTSHIDNKCVVRIIEGMENGVGWNTYVSESSQINIVPVSGKFNDAIKITYNLKQNGWVVISKNIDPEVLSGIEGIRFYYKGTGEPNIIEFKLIYTDENYNNEATFAFLENKSAVKDEWTSEVVPMDKFKCVSPEEICKVDSTPDINKIRKIEIAISSPGKTGGSGTLIIDDIHGIIFERCGCENFKLISQACTENLECESKNCQDGVCKKQEDVDSIWFLIGGIIVFLVIGIFVYLRRGKKKSVIENGGEKLNQQKEELKRKLNSLDVKGFESDAEQLKTRMNTIKNEDDVKAIEKEIEELKRKIEEIEAEREKLKKEIEEIEETLKLLNIKSFESDVKRLKIMIGFIKSKDDVKEVEKETEELMKKIDERKKIILIQQKLKEEVGEIEKNLNLLDIKNFESDVNKIKTMIEFIKSKDDGKDVEEELKKLKIRIEERIKYIKELKKLKQEINLPADAQGLKAEYEKLLAESKSAGDVIRTGFYCGELLNVYASQNNAEEALKYAIDLKNYAKGEYEKEIDNIIEQLKYRMKEKMDINDELQKEINVIVHQIKMGRG